jgi:hypothetical protein
LGAAQRITPVKARHRPVPKTDIDAPFYQPTQQKAHD